MAVRGHPLRVRRRSPTTTTIVVVALVVVALVLVALSAPLSVHARTSLLRRHHHAPAHAALSTPSDAAASPSVAAAQDADCQLRQFTLSSVATIEPSSSTANWTALAHSALRLDTLCSTSTSTEHIIAPRFDSPRARPSPPTHSLADTCDSEFFVATNGSDSNDGSFDNPFATLTRAFDATRAARALQHVASPCIILRAGTYYLGESLPASAGSPKDSQFGAIDLLPIDSGLTISAYPGESVTISGGARITPSWQVYAKTSTGTIYSTKLTPTNPPSQLLTDSFHLTEMFVGGERAVRAKWPNGDPSTHGLFSNDTGYDSSSMSWMAPFPHGDAQEIHVAQPTIPNAFFGTYQTAVDGAASVYDPPHSFWAMANPPGGAGATFIVPSGMNTKNTDLAARAAKWSNPSTGYVHAFHGGAWANWIFSIESYDTSSNELHFSEGGFQDARGWSYGGPFYVEWLLEELDDGFEWFFDESSQTLYFMPNGTDTAPPTELIVSQLPCILSAHGTPDSPVADVTLSDLTFSHTASTMMRKFEVPSGGDWSVHRGGAVFLTGTSNFAIQTSVFSYLGGTGVVVSNWNLGTSISYSEFVWGCDSGIIVLGAMPGVDEVSSTNQPDLVSITHNLFHELGIYIKQSAPVLISLSRSITVSSNLIFNVPRAGVNINDPFYGNHTIEGNVMFNTVRETADHGPINSWDRLPVLLRGVNATTGEPYHTMNPFVTHIWRNLLFNNYRSTWPIDHDDGSRLYDDAFNVLVYGGAKNYLGNSKWTHDSLFIYPDGQRFDTATEWLMKVQARRITPARSNPIGDSVDQLGDSFWGIQCAQTYAPQENSSGWNERWYNNTCAMWTGNQPYRLENCKVGSMTDIVPYLASNRLYFVAAGATAQIPCDLANGTSVNLSLVEMQALGYDVGTVEGPAPSTAELIQQAMGILF